MQRERERELNRTEEEHKKIKPSFSSIPKKTPRTSCDVIFLNKVGRCAGYFCGRVPRLVVQESYTCSMDVDVVFRQTCYECDH
mmetsp:Transcript_34133/g.50672  ORF Transcript_34133/g.50672 Transcript_34133/m.50672 type:complete len:83 (+) Transcript_34133:151-399(+)